MHGLYLLWWVEEKQVSPALVATILAGGDLVLLALELPTGWLADRFGHRLSLIVGSCVQTIGLVWCWLGQGVPGLLTASVLIALGDGFRSGADQALLYRTCVSLDRERAFQTIEARTKAVEHIALVALVLMGGVVVNTWGFAAGWIAEAVLSAAGIVIAVAMAEPPPVVSPAVEANPTAGSRRLVTRPILALIVPAALLAGAASSASFLAQTAGANDPTALTLLVAMITLAEAAGSTAAARIPASGARAQAMIAVSGAVLFGAGVVVTVTFPVLAVALAFLFGLAHPLRAAAIQRLAHDSARARAASLASACTMAAQAVALPLAGVWRGRRR